MSFGFPFREPRRPEGHPLLGHLFETTIEDARAMLERRPPTIEEADSLVVEELTGWDREPVIQLLRSYLPKAKWTD